MLMNDEYQPINCDDYDNLELACQHKLILKLELRDGEVIEAKAIDLLQKKRVEYLTIEQNGQQRDLRLTISAVSVIRKSVPWSSVCRTEQR